MGRTSSAFGIKGRTCVLKETRSRISSREDNERSSVSFFNSRIAVSLWALRNSIAYRFLSEVTQQDSSGRT